MPNRLATISVALVYTLILCGVVHFFINPIQPTAYMDEAFHEVQTITYINGDWYKWNKKITTPPGLYVLTTLLWRILPFFPSVENFRFLNCFIAGVNYILITELTQSAVTALAISTLPVLSFTALIFYTDQLSLFALLLTFLMQRSSLHFFAFLSGCFACFVRQTNVIWLAFMIGEQVVQRLSHTHSRGQQTAPQLCAHLIRHPVDTLGAFFKAAIFDAPHHTVTIILFAIFIFVFNGGDIVLGDRGAHKPVFHVPQIFYFFVFCAFHSPVLFLRYLGTLKFSKRRVLVWTLSCLPVLVLIHFFTFQHPYLLADNRHYTFYLWSRFFRRYRSFRYTLAPLYLVCGDYVCYRFRKGGVSGILTSLGYLVATALTLVPSGLIEPRYFIAPYVIWRMSGQKVNNETVACVVDAVLNVIVNVITVHIFLFHPFRWLSQPFTWQRFMW